jgi:hypothetical protein
MPPKSHETIPLNANPQKPKKTVYPLIEKLSEPVHFYHLPDPVPTKKVQLCDTGLEKLIIYRKFREVLSCNSCH